MKILMLSDLYPPVIGGGERHLESLSGELSQRGHRVTVCTIASAGLPRYEEVGEVKIYRLEGLFQRIPFLFTDATRKWHPPMGDWFITRQLRLILETVKPDIVHAHGRILYSFLPLKEEAGLPLVATPHSYVFLCPKTTLMKRDAVCDKPFTIDCLLCGKEFYGLLKSLLAYYGTRMNKGKLRLVDKFIVLSPFSKEAYAKALRLRDDDIFLATNFYNPDQGGEREGVAGLPEDFILFVGTLAPHKGIDVLIEAYQKLHTQMKLVLIGVRHPNYRYRSAENVLVIEDAPHSVVMAAMALCKFAVFPSISPDICPIVALEAMSQKKAVVASDIGGLKDMVIDGETGLLVAPHNSDRLAEAMALLLEKPERAREIGEKGYHLFLKNYTSEVVVPRIINLYQSLIQVKGNSKY
jgi:glycosyltransferase involved in cell wall biosynthesis